MGGKGSGRRAYGPGKTHLVSSWQLGHFPILGQKVAELLEMRKPPSQTTLKQG